MSVLAQFTSTNDVHVANSVMALIGLLLTQTCCNRGISAASVCTSVHAADMLNSHLNLPLNTARSTTHVKQHDIDSSLEHSTNGSTVSTCVLLNASCRNEPQRLNGSNDSTHVPLTSRIANVFDPLNGSKSDTCVSMMLNEYSAGKASDKLFGKDIKLVSPKSRSLSMHQRTSRGSLNIAIVVTDVPDTSSIHIFAALVRNADMSVICVLPIVTRCSDLQYDSGAKLIVCNKPLMSSSSKSTRSDNASNSRTLVDLMSNTLNPCDRDNGVISLTCVCDVITMSSISHALSSLKLQTRDLDTFTWRSFFLFSKPSNDATGVNETSRCSKSAKFASASKSPTFVLLHDKCASRGHPFANANVSMFVSSTSRCIK